MTCFLRSFKFGSSKGGKILQFDSDAEVMMSINNGNDVVPPFVEQPAPPAEKPKSDDRSAMSMSTMIFGLMALMLSMIGGGIFMYSAFQDGLISNLDTAWVKVIPIALAYGVGWMLCLLSMRSFSNLVLPLMIKYYSWLTLAGVLILYLKIMQKLFGQDYDMLHFFAYNVILFSGLAALLGLHLLLDEQHLRRYSIPIMVVCTWHLILMLLRFVIIEDSNPIYLFGDLYFFLVMFTLAVLMLAHLGIFNPLRNTLDVFFQQPGNKDVTD
jgi:hypothetical protein